MHCNQKRVCDMCSLLKRIFDCSSLNAAKAVGVAGVCLRLPHHIWFKWCCNGLTKYCCIVKTDCVLTLLWSTRQTPPPMVTQLSVFSFESLGEEEYIFIPGDRCTLNNPYSHTIASKEDIPSMESICLQQSCPSNQAWSVFSRYLTRPTLF